MRKILWVCHFLPFPSTGHGALQRTHHLIKRVAKHHQVQLFICTPCQGMDVITRELGVHRIFSSTRRNPISQPVTLAKSILSKQTYWDTLFYDHTLHKELCKAANTGDTIVILDTIFLAPYLRGINSERTIINHHNIESLLLDQRAERTNGIRAAFFSRQGILTRDAEREICPRVKDNLVVSPEDRTRLAEVVGEFRSTIVPNGVDIDYFSNGERAKLSQRPHSLIFAGGMDWYPNKDAMQWMCQDIWPSLSARVSNRTLTVIGRSPPSELKELAAKDPRVVVTGFVDDVRPYIHAAATYICPIRQGGGTRLKILDALALGCPLVATDLAVDGLALADGVHYLRANSVDEMHEALCRLDSDPELGQRISRAGRQHVVERFSWDHIADQLLEVLENLSMADKTASENN